MDAIADKDMLSKFRALMFHYWPYMQAAVITTRSYSDGLDLISRLRQLLHHFKGDLSPPEYARIDQTLIEFEFQLLDKMDAWHDYIQLYDRHRTTMYLRHYPPRKSGRWVDALTVYVDEEGKHLHFYYAVIQSRYEVICRKMETAKRRRSLNGLLHKRQAELSKQEIQERIERVLYAAKIGAQVFY